MPKRKAKEIKEEEEERFNKIRYFNMCKQF